MDKYTSKHIIEFLNHFGNLVILFEGVPQNLRFLAMRSSCDSLLTTSLFFYVVLFFGFHVKRFSGLQELKIKRIHLYKLRKIQYD